MLKPIIAFFLLPILYGRYSFILILPFALFVSKIPELMFGIFFSGIFMYTIFFNLLMGSFGFLDIWTRLIQQSLKIQYQVLSSNVDGYFKIISVNINEKHKEFKIPIHTGTLYSENAILRRKIIIYWLLKDLIK